MKKIMTIILAVAILSSLGACCARDDESLSTEIETNTEFVTEESETVTEEDTKEEIVEEEEVVEKPEKEEVVENPEKEEVVEKPEKEEVKGEITEEKGEEEIKDTTLGNTLLTFFKKEAQAGTKSEDIANKISQLPEITFGCVTNPVEPGYLPGFDEEITNFTSGVTFAPMIGSIPFVGYILETDDADTLIATLKENANLRWNICVEAEEMVVGKSGNKVFFVMCPKSLEE